MYFVLTFYMKIAEYFLNKGKNKNNNRTIKYKRKFFSLSMHALPKKEEATQNTM